MASETDGLVLPVGITEKEFVQALARLEARTAKMEGTTAKSFDGVSRSAKKAFQKIDDDASHMGKQVRGQLQNVGYQVQDFFVQVGDGTSATQALSQQLPQLLSGFGLVGIAAGTLAPLIISIGAAMLGSGNSAEETEKRMKSLAKAMDALEAANKKARTSSTDLMAQFGPMADQARQLYDVQKQLAEINLTKELNKTASMIGGSEFGSFDNKTADEWAAFGQTLDAIRGRSEALSKMSLTGNMTEEMQALSQADDEFLARNQNAIQQLAKMQTMFGVNAEQAGNLAAAFATLRDAKGADNISAAAAGLREQLSGALKNIDGTNEEAVKLVEQLLNAEDAALRTKAVDISANISAGAEQAKRMADELSRALSNAQSLAAQGLNDLAVAEINNKYRKDPVGKATALATLRSDTEVKIPEGADDRTAARLQQQKDAYVAAARAAAVKNEETRLADEADRKAAQAADKAAKAADRKAKSDSKAAESAQERYNKAIITLQGSSEATQQQIAAYESLNLAGGSIETQLTAITEKQKLLTAAAKAGIDLTPEQIAQADQLSQAYADQVAELDRLKSVASAGQGAMDDLFGSMLDGANSAKEAVANLLKQIAKVQFSKGMMGLLGTTSWGSGLVSTIGNLLTANAKGGVYDSPSLSAYSGSVVSSPTMFKFAKGGSLGLMGEAGSEAILPLSRMTNGELGVKAQNGSGGSSTAHITIDVTGAKGNTEIQEMVAAGVSQGLSAYDKRLPGRVQQISNNPRKR